MNYPTPSNESERLAALHRLKILDTEPTAEFDAVVAMAKAVFDAPIAMLSFMNEDVQWFKARVGLDEHRTSRDSAFCNYTILDNEPLEVEDALQDERFRHNCFVTGHPRIRYYLGVPISLDDETNIATLCVLDTKPRKATQLQLYQLEQLRVLVVGLICAHDASIKLWRAAHIDSLTGIANRFSFQSEIKRYLSIDTDKGGHLALLMIDLDNFKDINDDLGHLAGDEVLRKVAQRIVQSSSEGAFCARLGGDEFAVLLTLGPSTSTAQEFAAALLEELTSPIVYENHEIKIGASIGLAVCVPDRIETADDLILKSDLALYQAKHSGRGKLQIYEPSISSAYEERRSSVTMVKSAIKDARLVPHYQPIVDMGSNEIRGVEALARIRNADDTISGPGAFWHALSEPQCARDIDEVILNRALKDFSHWKRCGLDIDFISVNASLPTIQSEGFVARVMNGLAKNGLSPQEIKIEVVESVFLEHDGIDVGEVLEQLSSKGIRIALDDFGTGFASLSHLRDYPIDCIKIDKSFVLGLGGTGNNTAIVQALVGLGLSMNLDVIAEGIETSEQFDFLSALGVNYGQGYLFAKPMDAENTELLLTENREAKPKRLKASMAAA